MSERSWYHDAQSRVQKRRDPVDSALDTLATIALGYFGYQQRKEDRQDEKIKEEERFNRQLRLNQVNNIIRDHPDVDPLSYGNPIYNEDDYIRFTGDIARIEGYKKAGRDYIPPAKGDFSPVIGQNVYTHGAYKFNLDPTPGVTTLEDLLHFDAYLLGPEGQGRDYARKQNLPGILNKFDDDGNIYLGEEDAIALIDMGIITDSYLDVNDQGLYVLDRNQRDQIAKNYNNWREGFTSNRELSTKSEIKNSIVANNMDTIQKENKLQTNMKTEVKNFSNWNDFLNPKHTGFVLVDDDGKYTTDYLDEYGTANLTSLRESKFIERYPDVYNFIYGHTNIESALKEYRYSDELRNQLDQMPQLHATLKQKFADFASYKSMEKNLGIDYKSSEYIDEVNIMNVARDGIMQDLQTSKFGSGIIFDPVAWEQLTQEKQTEYVNKVVKLASEYTNPDSEYYNPDVIKFLSIYGYNDADNASIAQALAKFITETQGKR